LIAVSDGYIFSGATSSYEGIGGGHLTDYLMELLVERERKFGRDHMFDSTAYSTEKVQLPSTFYSTTHRQIVRDIKEKLCYVKQYPTEEIFEKSYELQDCRNVTLGAELVNVPEVLFDPSLIGSSSMGIHKRIWQSISKCPIDQRKDYMSNIVLCGGTTMFAGLHNRVMTEVAHLSPSTLQIKVIAPPERKYSVWIGGSILASLSNSQKHWVSRDEYDEKGPSAVLKNPADYNCNATSTYDFIFFLRTAYLPHDLNVPMYKRRKCPIKVALEPH